MSAATQQPPVPVRETAGRRRGSLVRAELLRFASRRFVQVLLGAAVLGWLAAIGIGLTVFSDDATPADYALAQERYDQALAEDEQWREDCAEEAESAGQPVDSFCGPSLADSGVRVEEFLDRQPFDLASAAAPGAMAFSAASDVLAFLVGATWIGAEWSNRSIVALLFWVPNRMRVMGSKLAVLVLAAAAIGLLAQAGWLAMASVLDATAGADAETPAGFWAHLLAQQGRGVLLTVLVALLGFGLANLTRNTGAALGAGFVYFAIVENTLRAFIGAGADRWTLTTNAAALVLPGGMRVYDYSASYDGLSEPPSFLVTNLQGGLVVSAYAAVLVAVGVWLFARRDLH
ncbi:hypothetical protein DQ237_16565 [Blastococcus sp. TF02-8]|uniref:hypothetical protein n=1 Tax=Blastococcus sp. TF02-8 TaxID=2250574 RepID=UPI000DE8341A|nr:hypothetical protein [Blastococcus sp. TF02-8]RBY93785.1 hypothetical protein DQ237_16565 [Blastococcus sp. TF02-8]